MLYAVTIYARLQAASPEEAKTMAVTLRRLLQDPMVQSLLASHGIRSDKIVVTNPVPLPKKE